MPFTFSKSVSSMNVEELSSELDTLIDTDDIDDYILKLSKGNKEDDILSALELQLFNYEVNDVQNNRQVYV